jgi:hypothetical protein
MKPWRGFGCPKIMEVGNSFRSQAETAPQQLHIRILSAEKGQESSYSSRAQKSIPLRQG